MKGAEPQVPQMIQDKNEVKMSLFSEVLIQIVDSLRFFAGITLIVLVKHEIETN